MAYNLSISDRRREYMKPRCDLDHRPNCSDLHSTPRLNAWRSWMQLRDPSQPGTSSWVVLDRAAPVQLTMLGLLYKIQLLLKVWSLGTRSSSRQRDPKPSPPDKKCQKVVMLICLDILKDQWSPALNLKTALLSLPALLSTPEPRDPQDAVVARRYLNEYTTFLGTARYWTETFAKVSNIGFEGKVQKLVEMGFPEDLVRTTLEAAEGDENLALEKLCSC